MKKFLKILKIFGIVLASAVVLFAGFIGVTTIRTFTRENKDPATQENTTGLVQAIGTSLYDANGNLLRLKGANVGGGLVCEGWLEPYSCGPSLDENGNYVTDADGNVQYPELWQNKMLEGFKSNPNLTDEQRKTLKDTFIYNWFSEDDFKICSEELKFNCLRLPFSYHELLNDDFSRRPESEAFEYFDWFLGMCKKYNMYCVLDMHCAPVTQSGYEHSGDMGTDLLYDSPKGIAATCDMWKYIAEHYLNNDLGKYIASYDLMNEPTDEYHTTSGPRVYEMMDKMYDAIRSTGDKHVITICVTWMFDKFPNPKDYGWENIQYQIHIYNWWSSALPNWLLYDGYEITNWGHEWNVPYYVGEFTFFEDDQAWQDYLALFDKRGYSWSFWSYKKNVVGSWNDSWGMINQKSNLKPGELKVDLTKDTFDTLKNCFEKCHTKYCEKSTTYNSVYKYMNK